MPSTQPTVLFVHGSWHNPNHFQRIRDLFEKHGFHTSCPLHPSVGKLPPVRLKEDAQCIWAELKTLIDHQQKSVIVVAHSYGGIVASEAVDAKFSRATRETKGLAGGVIRLVCLCAFLLPLGVSLKTAFGGRLPPFVPIDEQGMCVMLEPERRFYNDLPEEEQKHWTSELKPCPAIAQMTPLSQVAYLHHPTTYLFCENDQALPFEIQDMIVRKAREESGATIDAAFCTAGHSPFLSQPETVLKLVQAIVAT